jgi:hypothetical protein
VPVATMSAPLSIFLLLDMSCLSMSGLPDGGPGNKAV